MALKDWKHLRKDEWQKQLNSYAWPYLWISEKEESNIFMNEKSSNKYKVYYNANESEFRQTYLLKAFKTKSQALKFAKSYMKNH